MKYWVKYFIYLIIISLVGMEMMLRMLHFEPGIFLSLEQQKKSWVDLKCDSIYMEDIFIPDSLGLPIANPHYFENKKEVSFIYERVRDSFEGLQLNSNGFRCPEFKIDTSTTKSFFFVGDSFTFGFDAIPLNQSFVDLFQLQHPEYLVYNAGVPGIDLLGCKIVIENYIQKVHPDYLVLCVYVNDWVNYDKKNKPNDYNYMFPTSCGLLLNDYERKSGDSVEVYLNFRSAYANIQNKFSVKYINDGAIKFLLSHSVLASLLYAYCKALPKMIVKDVTVYKKENKTSAIYRDIYKMCNKNNTKLITLLIPGRKNLKKEHNIPLFSEMLGDSVTMYWPYGIAANHYGKFPHVHFNNEGISSMQSFWLNLQIV